MPFRQDEATRLKEEERYAILSTLPDETFDRITNLATRLFHCPITLLSLAAINRQWLKSSQGIGVDKISGSLASWANCGEAMVVIPDATHHPRFAGSGLETGGLIRFFAGAPVISPGGLNIGTLCIIDHTPRPQGLSPEERATLRDLAGMVIEVLDARLAAHEAEQVKDFLQTTLSSIGDGMIATDAEGRITFMNPVAEELTGWQREEARGKPISGVFVIVNETTRAPVSNPIIRALAEDCVIGSENHTILLTRDGRELPIDDSAAPIRRDGCIAGGVLIFRDVSQRRTVERARAYSENQFRRTFANAPLGLVLTHMDGRFIESNKAYRNLTGYTAKELTEITFISLTHPDEIENNRALFQRLLREEIPSYVLEKRIFNKDGVLKWVRAHASLLRDADGKAHRVIGLVEDVSERKLAEQRFRFLAESIPQMVWTATAEGMIDYVNAQGTQYFGLPQEALLGAGWLDCVHPDDQAKTVTRWTEPVQTGKPYEAQFRLKRGGDSSWRYHLVRALPLAGDDGRARQWFGTCTDIEDQHRAARQIEDDRRRWRELLLQVPAAIAVLRGPQHTFVWLNPDCERLLGRPAELLIGKPLLEALPEMASQVYAGQLDDVFRKGEPLRAIEAVVRLGADPAALKELAVNFVYLPTRNTEGEIDGIFVHGTDVTGVVAARKANQDSESQFRTLAETIPHLAWMADETGHIFWYNHRWYDYTGTSLKEMEGWGWQSVHDPEVLPDVLAKWHQTLSSGEPLDMVFPLRRADGEFRPFLTRVEPIKDGHGKVVRWFGTNTDITEQRRTEEQLRRINRDLEEFSYVASHDLQEPLRMVNIYTELLLREKDGAKENLEAFAGFVAEGVKRMEVLIHDLLSFSRNVHTEELVAGPADLAIAFHEALAVLTIRIEETGAVVTAADLPMARGDTSQMAHVFQNVLSNALKYRKESVAPQIQVGAKRDGKHWVISIQDNGIGFDAQYAGRIFGLFKRLHKDAYPGTGLGLAICKRIVERYGGRMWAESVPGEGSTFYFSLPVASE